MKTQPIGSSIDLSNHGFVSFRQSTLQEILTNSGHLAVRNEFQVHYWSLVLRHTASDSSILDIVIPTVFFNYPQEVTSCHISFRMKDVSAISGKLLPVHKVQATKILSDGKLVPEVAALIGIPEDSIEVISVPYMTMHRHPGSSIRQSFSGIDLDRTPDDPGIVYPLKSANSMPSISTIVAIDDGQCNLAHSEYRLVNGSIATSIEYVKGRCFSSSVIQASLSKVEALFLDSNDKTYEYRTDNSLMGKVGELLTRFLDDKIPAPLTQFINPNNLKQKEYTTYNQGIMLFGNKRIEPDENHIPRRSKAELSTMARKDLIKILMQIDAVFDLNVKEADYSSFSDSDLYNSILEGYDEVEEELVSQKIDQKFAEEQDRQYLEEDLLTYGLQKSDITQATTSQLRTWLQKIIT